MSFGSFVEFISMGKHGFYVWTSYAIVLVSLALLYIITNNNLQKFKESQQSGRHEQ